ncbi:MAG TPA: hypothetical protein VHO24_08820 [Opitutaceae bacterium]|nr:hypothetical protein [Opitutaceae bacterium]
MTSWIKKLIWVYLVLLLIEGAFRKWWLPSMADAFLVVRDPVVLAIYALAFVSGTFPRNSFMVALGGLAAASVVASVLAGQTNPLVVAYGMRINYLHVPLIWVMGSVLNRKDVERIGTFFLVAGIVMTWVMVKQFNSPMDASINRGVGAEEGGQIFGADGRIRPPGLFAFITGPQLFFPLCAAFFFDQIGGAKRMPWYLLVACGLAIAIALPVSISRYVMIGTGIVAVMFLITLPLSSSRLASMGRPLILLCLLAVALSQLPVFKQGTTVFMMRWDQAAHESDGQAWGSLIDRTFRAFTNTVYFVEQAPFFGHGIGVGSNVGSRLLYGTMGFVLAEEEWGKVILELGPILGFAFILFRTWLSIHLGLEAWRAARHDHNTLPLLIWAALVFAIFQGQWAPPTVLGFAVIGGGLILGAINPVPVVETEEAAAIAEAASTPLILAQSTHAALPTPSDRRPPIVIRSVEK